MRLKSSLEIGNRRASVISTPATPELPDRRVPGFLGRVLSPAGTPIGTCFQLAPGLLVTAWHVLNDLGAAEVDAQVTVDPLAGGSAITARVIRVDEDHDVAVVAADAPLAANAKLAETDLVPLATSVRITGYAQLNDVGRSYRFLDAVGEWAGGTTRDDDVRLGCVTANRVVPGMSGAPVVQGADVVVGMVSGRYNTVNGWFANNVWVVRTEDLSPLLAGIADVEITSPEEASAPGSTALWVHGGIPAQHFSGRVEELSRLHRWVKDPEVHIIGVTAWGGAGKTALVTELIVQQDAIKARQFRGFFGWSFYEDPTVENWAQKFLSWINTTFDFHPQKGALPVQILEALRAVPLLLVFDGLEVLQEGPSGSDFGRLLDGALRAVLIGLCRMESNTLAVLTSRFPFADLEYFDGSASRMLDVPPLTPIEGADLLSEVGAGWLSRDQRIELVGLVDGHALAVNVLAAALRHHMPTADLLILKQQLSSSNRTDERVAKVLRFYANRLGEEDRTLVSIVSLFQQPVDVGAILSLGSHEYLGRALAAWTMDDVETASLQRLTGLVTWHSEGLVSSHPLIRDVFRSMILSGKTAQLASEIALSSLPSGPARSTAEAQRIVEIIELLLDSGEWGAARELYSSRTRNGRIWMRLPAARLGQRCAMAFIQAGLNAGRFSEQEAGYFANEAGLFAMQAGDIESAERLLKDGAKHYKSFKSRDAEAVTLRNLSRCLAFHGYAAKAREAALRALELALDIGNIERIRNARACLAVAMDLNGEIYQAQKEFETANKIQVAADGRELYSTDGTWWADLLLRVRRVKLARRITTKNLEVCESQGWNANSARCYRLLGRCDLADGHLASAVKHLVRAADVFREGEYIVELAETLPYLAECHRRTGELDEGESICTESITTLTGPRELIPTSALCLAVRGRIKTDRYVISQDDSQLDQARDDADHCLRLATKVRHLPWSELLALEVHSAIDKISGNDYNWHRRLSLQEERLIGRANKKS